MQGHTILTTRKILNKKLVLTVACLYFLVNVVGCSGYRFNGVALNSSDNPMYVDSGQITTDASNEDEEKKKRRILILLFFAGVIGGLFAWGLYEANRDDTTIPWPPPPPPPHP